MGDATQYRFVRLNKQSFDTKEYFPRYETKYCSLLDFNVLGRLTAEVRPMARKLHNSCFADKLLQKSLRPSAPKHEYPCQAHAGTVRHRANDQCRGSRSLSLRSMWDKQQYDYQSEGPSTTTHRPQRAASHIAVEKNVICAMNRKITYMLAKKC